MKLHYILHPTTFLACLVAGLLGMVGSTSGLAAEKQSRLLVVLKNAEFVVNEDRKPPGDSVAWQPVALPDNWHVRMPNFDGTGWYRLRIELPYEPRAVHTFRMPHRRASNLLVLANGALIQSARNLRMGNTSDIGAPITISIPPSLLKRGQNHIHVRLTGKAELRHGLGTVTFGNSREPRTRSEIQSEINGGMIRVNGGALVALGLLTLALWWARRRDSVLFWFSVTCLIGGLAGLAFVWLRWWEGGLWLRPMLNFTFRSGFLTPCIIVCLRAAGFRLPRFEAMLWALLVLGLGTSAVSEPLSFSASNVISSMGYGVAALTGAAIILFRAPRPLGFSLAILPVVLGLAGLFTLSEQARWHGLLDIDMFILRGLSVPPLILAVGAAIVDRHVMAFRQLERMNVELEQRVAEKAHEIEAYHREREEVLRQQALAHERQRIITDMHYGLGASLVGLLHYVQNKAPDVHLEQRVREALQELRIAIDALEPAEGDLGTVLGNLRYRLEPLLEPTGIRLEWEVAELPRIEALEPSAVFALQRVVLEAVANSLKHSGATRICLSARTLADEKIEICVEDDGRGFDSSQSAVGVGLTSMRARAARLGGRIEIISGAGTGTAVRLVIPSALPRSPEPRQTESLEPHGLERLAPAPGAA